LSICFGHSPSTNSSPGGNSLIFLGGRTLPPLQPPPQIIGGFRGRISQERPGEYKRKISVSKLPTKRTRNARPTQKKILLTISPSFFFFLFVAEQLHSNPANYSLF
jgi:hypothetical protein